MSSTANDLRARNLRTLAALAGLFLLPLVTAFWMYYATGWRPAGRVNHGELIIPPRPLPHLALARVDLESQHTPADGAPRPSAAAPEKAGVFRDRWTLVYVGNGRCDDSCRRALYVMRQARLALNNDLTRVERVFLVTADCCAGEFAGEFLAREHAGLVVLDATGPGAGRLLHEFPPGSREDSLFIVDPLGNLMMSYDARANPKGLLEDLQKLLRLSHVG